MSRRRQRDSLSTGRFGRRLARARRGRSDNAWFEVLEGRTLLTASPLGNEYQINTTVNLDQRAIAIAENPQSTQVVMAWVSNGEDGNLDGVYAQRFDRNGAAIGAAFRVNVTTAGNQNAPAVAMDSLGNFVVVWQSAGQDGSGDGIYGRRYGYDATPLATEFRVNSTTSGNQQAPSIAMADNGDFAVAFQSSGRDSSNNAVVARLFRASGTAVANDFQVNQFVTGNQQAPSIAMDAAGNSIIAWQSANQDAHGDAVMARKYNNLGTAFGVEFQVNQTINGNQNAPSVAANSDGSFIVAWQSADQDGNSDGIVARRYASGGTVGIPLSNEFLVNQFAIGSQAAPSVSTSLSGGAIIAWQSAAQDGSGDTVVARQYDAAGLATGDEFVVNTFVAGAQNGTATAIEADGDFIIGWQSPAQEAGGGTSLGVFARRYNNANDAPVLRQSQNQIADPGGVVSFTAKADDQDLPSDSIAYSLGADAQPGMLINPTTGAFSWTANGSVTPGRYMVTVVAQDSFGASDQKVIPITIFAPGERTALDTFVNKVDPTYKWDIRGRTIGDGFVKYDILLTSGTWRTLAEVNKPLWQHWMEVYVPNVITNDKALLFIDGGSFSSTPPTSTDLDAYAGPVAASTGAVFIDLLAVPSEPLQFAGESFTRSEDSIIAYSWRKYLETGDETWPVNLAMTRAAMRAMDAVTDFLGSPVGGNFNLESFVVTGGSKRGWTTWLASAADPRVSDAVPIVSDLLNMENSFVHHYAYYNGAFSAAVQDYVNEGILNINKFGTEPIDKLLSIVDPYTYLNRLTLPKYMINVSGDEFFVPDSWSFYYDDLLGPKAVRYLPNSSHGISNPTYFAETVNTYVAILGGAALPAYTFHQLADGTIELSTSENVTDAKLWKATNANARDFRWPVVGAAYTSTQLSDQGGGVYRGNVPTPAKGWTAYFVELTIVNDEGQTFKVTSGIYIKGPPINIEPTLQPIADVVIAEGSSLQIANSASDVDAGQTLTYSLYPGDPAQVSINPTTGFLTGSWNDQVAGQLPVIVTVFDNGTPPLPARTTFRVTVVNAPPTAVLNGPAGGTAGDLLSFTLVATDPSSVDQAAGFDFGIDWDNDGTTDQTVHGASGTVVTHTFAAPGNYHIRLTATDKDGGASTPAPLDVTVAPIPTAPQVTAVQVGGSSWSAGFLAALQTAGLGNGLGYAIPVGSAAQLKPLAWSSLNQIQIVFDQDVNVSQSSLTLSGINVPTYAISGFSYVASSHTATWTLDDSINTDRLTIELNSTGPNAVANTHGDALDGEWIDGTSAYNSGDGSAGANFQFSFNVLPADVTQDGIVNAQDIAGVAANWFHLNDLFAEINGDGVVNSQEIATLGSHWLASLPAVGAGSSALLAMLNSSVAEPSGVTHAASAPPLLLSAATQPSLVPTASESERVVAFLAKDATANVGIDSFHVRQVAEFVSEHSSALRTSPAAHKLARAFAAWSDDDLRGHVADAVVDGDLVASLAARRGQR